MKKVSRKVIAVGLVAAVAALAVAVAVATAGNSQQEGEHPGLRPDAGHQYVRPLGAVRRARHREGIQGGRRHLRRSPTPWATRRSRSRRRQRASPPARRWSSRPARLRLGRRDREGVHRRRAARRSTTTARSPTARRPPTSRSTATRSDGPRRPASSPPSRARRSRSSPSSGAARGHERAWFKSGNDDILNPLFKSGKITKGPQQFVPGLVGQRRGERRSSPQMLVKTNNKIDGVIAANDNIAGAVVAQLKAKHLKPIPLSGQDATVAGRAEHHLRLADRNGLQARAPAGACRGRGRGRARQGQEAGLDHDEVQRQEAGADGGASCPLDHEGELAGSTRTGS